jgi:hypothetical protein
VLLASAEVVHSWHRLSSRRRQRFGEAHHNVLYLLQHYYIHEVAVMPSTPTDEQITKIKPGWTYALRVFQLSPGLQDMLAAQWDAFNLCCCSP